MAYSCTFVRMVIFMTTYRSEQMLFDYILYGVPSFPEVKRALQIDFIDHGMNPLRYSYNLQLLYSRYDSINR